MINPMPNHPHTHKEEPPVYNSTSVTPGLKVTIIEPGEEPRSWENEFYDVLPIISSDLTVDSKVSKIKKVFERLLSTREKEVREEYEELELIIMAVENCMILSTNPATVNNLQRNVLAPLKRLTPKTEIR